MINRVLLLICLHNALFIATLQASEVEHRSFHSQTLGEEYVYNIYLPDGYQDSGLHYSVLYLLHGNLGTEQSWVGPGHIQATTDALIDSGAIQPLLIVIPADPKFWWADSHGRPAMTALVNDLLADVQDQFRTIEERQGRAIGGYSAGGFGAANIVLKYPELFAAAAPLSPAVYTPVPPLDSSATRQDTFLTDGEFDPARWEALNWVSFIDAYKATGIIVPFYINTGDHDRYDIAYHAAVFFKALRDYQPDYAEFRVFDGDHNFAAWGGTIGLAMEYLSRFLAAPR
ncbi:MAG: alpha/beta hydrolase-fold protein [Gammaproteobacteria bacterium]|nr:prolyl oligopeptidase family serine peptidase [Pseudomonadales bacterium]